MAGALSGGSYTGWVSDPMRHWGLMCNAKLAFPGKSTQEPQRGGGSSSEADSRLTANSLLFFCSVFYGFLFLQKVIWTRQNFCLQPLLHKSSWIHPVCHCFAEQLKQQPKQDKRSSVHVSLSSLPFFSFFLFHSPFIFHPHSLAIVFFSSFLQFHLLCHL